MTRVFLITSLLALAPIAYGQTTNKDAAPQQECKLMLEQSPAIRGLRLGMTAEDVSEIVVGNRYDGQLNLELSKATDRFGYSNLNVFVSGPLFKPKFAGVNQLWFQFLDRRVTSITIYYEGPEWNSVDEFISRISEALKLPGVSAWKAPYGDGSTKSLKCNGFELAAASHGGRQNSIRIQDSSADRVLNERKAEAKEKARREFKP